MQVKRFIELSELEKRKMYEYINSLGSNYYFSDFAEMQQDYSGVVFDGGKNQFSLWDEDMVKGTLGLITKDVKERGEIFITGIYVKEEDKTGLKILLDTAVEISSSFQPQSIKLGISSALDYLIPVVEESDFNRAYRSLVMRLQKDYQWGEEQFSENIEFQNLSNVNQKYYRDVHNRAFISSPNGGIITVQEMEEILSEYEKNPHLAQLCLYDGEPAGIFELGCKQEVGWIGTLAVDPAFQGKGLGKTILRKAVDLLNESGMKEVKLVVMSTNERAMKLYEKCGFEVDKVSSTWFEMGLK